MIIFAGMKTRLSIWFLALLLALTACDGTTREARRMVKRAERLADTLPDSAVRLIDSVLRMPVNFRERERMDMALLQAEALFGCRDVSRNVSKNNDTLGDVSGNVSTISPIMDDDFFDDHANLSTSPELERAAAYYARKEDYDKAAHAALYSGFVQQYFDEKEAAMHSFKEAEQYGMMAGDSLTVARAEYKMGKMLFDEYMEQEAQDMFRKSKKFIGNHHTERASIENSEAVIYILMGQFDDADSCLQRGMILAEKWHSDKVIRKIHNNYSVLYRLQGKYDQAVDCLHRMKANPNLGENDMFVLNLNLGNVYFDMKEMDSAARCYQFVELVLPKVNVKKETVLAAYEALYRFAEDQNDDSLALQYRELHEKGLYDLMVLRQKQTIYRIQKQFDYESLQNEMNKKLLQRQRLITLLAVFTIIGLGALAVSQIRLAKIRKQEAEANANLFHFMQQNKALVESNMAKDQKVLDADKQLSDMLRAKLMAMLKLNYCLKTPIDKIAAKDLEKEVFGGGDHWKAVKEVLDSLYPGLWETIKLKYPTMDEMEHRVCMLSRLKLSRLSEAALIGVSVSVLDKIRTRVHKMVEQEGKL